MNEGRDRRRRQMRRGRERRLTMPTGRCLSREGDGAGRFERRAAAGVTVSSREAW